MRLNKHLILSMIVLTLVAGCGLKRNLELPGRDKNKTDTQQTTPDASSQTTQTDKTIAAPGGGGATLPGSTAPVDLSIPSPSLSSTDSATPPAGSDNPATH